MLLVLLGLLASLMHKLLQRFDVDVGWNDIGLEHEFYDNGK